MKISNALKKMWNDPVGSKLIANAIWALPAIIALVALVFKNGIEVLFLAIPVYYFVLLFFLMSVIITILLLKIKKIQKNFNYIKNENDKINEENSKLKERPKSERIKYFNIGDIVKIKSDNNMSNPVKYIVVEKNINEIVCVDKDNQRQKFVPEALSTSEEFEKEMSEYKNLVTTIFSLNRKK